MTAFEEIMSDPYLCSFFKGVARMLGEYYQTKVPEMSSDELYAISDFLPAYNTERHDYTQKPDGYTCRKEDGTIMTLIPSSMPLGDHAENGSISQPMWHCHWSTDPSKAKAFISDDISPYSKDECCFWDGKVFRSVVDDNCLSPEDAPNSWEEIPNVVLE